MVYSKVNNTKESDIFNIVCKKQNSIGVWVQCQCEDATSLCVLNSVTSEWYQVWWTLIKWYTQR